MSRYLARMTASSARGRSGTSRSTMRAICGVNQMNKTVLATLNTVWAFAICLGVSAASRAVPDSDAALGENAVTASAN